MWEERRGVVVMQYSKRISVSILIAAAMVLVSFAALPSGQAETVVFEPDALQGLQAEPTLQGTKNLANVPADEKIDAALREQMASEKGELRVDLLVTDREAVNEQLASMELPLIKGFELVGMPTPRTMDLTTKQIWLLAANPGVYSVESHALPTYEAGVDKMALEASGLEMAPTPVIEDYDVNVVHGAVDAWAKGYTGTDVRIAVIDTGFDMAHPDLQGQQARYTSGPYMGWPIAFDDLAATYWSMDMVAGWVADTSTYVTESGGLVEFDSVYYEVDDLKDVLGNPVTSQSGSYLMGYHTDQNLAMLHGTSIAVLVVDSAVAGVYDTVYVDVTCDYSFNNDKACTQGDEISYFDFYDADFGTYDFSNWDAGDGYADLSGGMIYWISDGTNVLPASDWVYGAVWTPPSGEAVAFMGEFFYMQSHGTMTSSAALATGRTLGGMLGGMAPDAKLITIPMTYSYFGPWLFATMGADGIPDTDDDPHIVSNSYGFSDTAIWSGYDYYDAVAWYLNSWSDYTLWCWSTGNGGPGYGTAHSITDHSSIHVGAGTTMQYRGLLGYEPFGNQKWGDVTPFSNSGPGRNGKLNAEVIASGAYSLEPAPLNQWDLFGSLGDGAQHLQIGSGTSHACPTVAGGAALGYNAYMVRNAGTLPWDQDVKSKIMASADDMHFDVFKQGSGWLNSSRLVEFMGNWEDGTETLSWYGPQYLKSAIYPGTVYGTNYETFPDLMYPGDSFTDPSLGTINYNPVTPVDVNVTCMIPLLTSSDTVHMVTESADDVIIDITSYVPATTDLLKVTMFMPFSQFDEDMDYSSDASYWLELHDWLDLNLDGSINITGAEWELFRYTVDGSDCNYNQVMVKDPIERTNDGLVVRARSIEGAEGLDMTFRLDCYELQPFPWVTFNDYIAVGWSTGLDMTINGWGGGWWQVNVAVPSDAPVGSYGAGIYVDDGNSVQCVPIVINVAADSYEFDFGGPSMFDTPYNNSFTGIADKGWRFEVGDWRIFWSMPLDSIPSINAKLVTTVEWAELPTDVNVHVLGSWDWGDWNYELPMGPGYGMQLLASSDERYLGAGTFGIGTNTGGPKEVIAADFGMYYLDWGVAPMPSPFAIVTRCPVMSGSSAYEMISGTTSWIEINDYDPWSIDIYAPIPGPVNLSDNVPGWYNITVDSDVEVKGSGLGPLTYEVLDWQPIYQDMLTGSFDDDVANAEYEHILTLEGCDLFEVSTYEISNAPDIDLGVWYDENADGVADMSEPYWLSGTAGSSEFLSLEDLEDGQYIIKVLGYTVVGSPGYFGLEMYIDLPGSYVVVATDLEPLVGSGVHEFNVSYSVPAVHGEYYGYATFGFMGADDMIEIPFYIYVEDNAPPAIENMYPADGDVLGTSTVEISFDVNDHVECFSGLDPGSVWITLDGWLGLWMTTIVEGTTVVALIPWALPEGDHMVDIQVADIRGNWVYEEVFFEVDSIIEVFDVEFAHPESGLKIDSGSTVALDEVTVRGWTDADSDIDISSPHGSYSLQADEVGYFEQEGVALVEGYNVFEVTVTNVGDVTQTTSLMIVSDLTCTLWVAEPTGLTADAHMTLQGFTEMGAAVTVDGSPAAVGPDGSWTADVTLSEGDNALLVEAEDALGNTASATVHVTLDTTPPDLEIDSPDDDSTVDEPSVVVEGTTDAGAWVYVNGVLASDGSSSWEAIVVLAEGGNTITVTAMDELGNSVTETVSVTYEPPVYVTPDELDEVQQDLDDTQLDLDETQQDLQGQVDDGDSFAMMMLYIIVILFIVSVILSLVLWNNLRGKMRGGGSSHSMEEVENEPPAPSDVEREFEEFGKEMDKGQ